MHFFLLFLALLAVGISSSSKSEGYPSGDTYERPQYRTSYAVSDKSTGDQKTAMEVRDGGITRGTYSLVQPDGVVRRVNYIVTPRGGFQAEVFNNGISTHPSIGKEGAGLGVFSNGQDGGGAKSYVAGFGLGSLDSGLGLGLNSGLGFDSKQANGFSPGFGYGMNTRLGYGNQLNTGLGYGNQLNTGLGYSNQLNTGLGYGNQLKTGLGLGNQLNIGLRYGVNTGVGYGLGLGNNLNAAGLGLGNNLNSAGLGLGNNLNSAGLGLNPGLLGYPLRTNKQLGLGYSNLGLGTNFFG